MSAFDAGSMPGRSADAELSLGLVRCGDAVVALPVEHLREVIRRPTTLGAWPCASPWVRGAVLLRGTVIPVIDLAGVLGLDGSAEDGVIVLMRHGGRLLGLLAHGVCGMARVRPDELHPVHVATVHQAAVATHGFALGEGFATLLDAARIAALPDVPTVAEPKPAAAAHVTAGAGRSALLLLAAGGVRLAVEAGAVHATVPRGPLQDSPLKRGACRGVIAHHGVEVPVLDTLSLLGLGCGEPAAEAAVLVLRAEAGLVALTIDEVRDIVRPEAGEVLPIQPIGLAEPAAFRGVYRRADDPSLLLDWEALAGTPAVTSLAAMNRSLAVPPGDGTASVHTRERRASGGRAVSYLTYWVEVETASPLDQVSEIVSFPAQWVPLPVAHEGTIGLFTHRGEALPLICLATLLGQRAPAQPQKARVLIVGGEGWKVGVMVEALCSIESARWETGTATPDDAPHRVLKPLIEVGAGEQRRTLPRLDLRLLLRPAGRGNVPSAHDAERPPSEHAAATAEDPL